MTSAEQVVSEFGRTPHGLGHSEQTRRTHWEGLRSPKLLSRLSGLSVKEIGDDDATLFNSDGHEITTWKQDYPYAERMSRDEYEHIKRFLQIELLKMQSWAKDTGQRVVVLFEGRDAA